MRRWLAHRRSRPGRPSARFALGTRVWWVVLAWLVAACGPSTSSALSPSIAPSGPPTFALLHSSETPNCPLVGSFDVTFRIDPYAGEPVTVVAGNGQVLHVWWPPGFVAGTFDDAVVKDPSGAVVARDGQRLIAPKERDPTLPGGWDVCFGDGAIWVQLTPVQ